MGQTWPTVLNGKISAARAWAFQRGVAWMTLAIVTVIYVGGWTMGYEPLTRVLPGFPAIVRSTLICAGLSAIALIALNYRLTHYKLVIFGAAVLIAMITGYTELIGNPSGAGADRMSRGTAIEFVLFAIAIVVALAQAPASRLTALVIASLGAAFALLPLAAYLLDPESLWQVGFLAAMSPQTATIAFLLFSALLLSFYETGWVATLLSDGPGGQTARRFLPLAIIGPIFFGYAGLHLVSDAWRNNGFHVGIITVLTVCGAFAIILGTANQENQRQAQAERENARLRAVIDGIDAVAVFVLDVTGSLRMRNEVAREIFGHLGDSGDWLLSERFISMSDRRDLVGPDHPVRRLIQNQADQYVHAGWTDQYGRERFLRLSAIRLPGERDDLPLFFLSIEDQTESWLLREGLSEDQRSEGIGQLTWGIAHELASVLGIVQISAESARLDGATAQEAKNLDAILQACRRGTDLTRELLEMSRNKEREPALLDMVEVLRPMARLASRVMPAIIKFDVSFPDRPLLLSCVRTDLESAALNLLANARNAIIEAGHERGEIHLTVSEQDGMIEVTVSDDGPGITEDLIGRVRDPYFTTRSELGGRGIGLTLVDTFVRRVGGTFELLAHEPHGTRAVMRMPLVLSENGKPGPQELGSGHQATS